MSKKYLDSLEDYPEIPIGFAKDLRGETFGDFQVCYRTINKTKPSAKVVDTCIKVDQIGSQEKTNVHVRIIHCREQLFKISGKLVQS